MLKQFIALTLVISMSVQASAQSCPADRSATETDCSDDEYKEVTQKTTDIQNYINKCASQGGGASPVGGGGTPVASSAIPTACTGDSMREGVAKITAAKKLSEDYSKRCGESRGKCTDSCKAAQSNPTTQAEGASGEAYCEGKPKENEEGSKGNSDALMGALAQLLSAMMAKGQKPPEAAVASVCGQQQSAPPQGATLAPGAATAAATAAQICPTLDKQSKADSTFTDGTGRNSAGGEYLGDGDLSSGSPAAGTPAQVSLSSALPGGVGAGGGGPGAGASGGGGRDPGKKGTNGEPENNKIGLASSGGGAGGGGSLAGTGRSGAGGPAGAPSRTSVDGADRGMQAAIDKAVQQRGIASDGPAGGISGANSFDNFQKVERRMQSERNNLNEL